MRTVPLSPHLADCVAPIERTESGAIWAEIAERLLELYERDGARTMATLQRLSAITVRSPMALPIILRMMSGDLDALTESYRKIGYKQARSKQAVQQMQRRALDQLADTFPELRAQIMALRRLRESPTT